jgi:hypothetical protein
MATGHMPTGQEWLLLGVQEQVEQAGVEVHHH